MPSEVLDNQVFYPCQTSATIIQNDTFPHGIRPHQNLRVFRDTIHLLSGFTGSVVIPLSNLVTYGIDWTSSATYHIKRIDLTHVSLRTWVETFWN